MVSQPPARGVTRSFPPASRSVVSVVFRVLESLSPLRSPKPDLVGDHTRVSLDERGMYGMFFNEQFMKFLCYMFRKFFKLKSTNISPRKLEFAAARMQALVLKDILHKEQGGGKDKKRRRCKQGSLIPSSVYAQAGIVAWWGWVPLRPSSRLCPLPRLTSQQTR